MNLSTSSVPAIQADSKYQAVVIEYADELRYFGAETDIDAETYTDGLGDQIFTITLRIKGRRIGSYGSWKELAKEIKILAKLAPAFRNH